MSTSEGGSNLPVPAENKRPTTRAGREAVKRPGLTSKRVKRRFRKILSSRELYASIQTIIANPSHPHFPKVLDTLLKYGQIPTAAEAAKEENGDDGNNRLAAPTALPAQVVRTEKVTKVYDEAGTLVKVYGKRETKIHGPGPDARSVEVPKEVEIPDGEYEILEEEKP